jgi:hypothetical protein
LRLRDKPRVSWSGRHRPALTEQLPGTEVAPVVRAEVAKRTAPIT